MDKKDFLDILYLKRQAFSLLPAMAEDARDGETAIPHGEWVEPEPSGPGVSGMPIPVQIDILKQGAPPGFLEGWDYYGTNLVTMDQNGMRRGDIRDGNLVIISEPNESTKTAWYIDRPGIYEISGEDDINIAVDTREFKQNDTVTFVPSVNPIGVVDYSGFNSPRVQCSIYKYTTKYVLETIYELVDRNGIRISRGFSLMMTEPEDGGPIEIDYMTHDANYVTGLTYNHRRRGDAIIRTLWLSDTINTITYGTCVEEDMPSWNEVTGVVSSGEGYAAGYIRGKVKVVSANPVSHTQDKSFMIGDHNASSLTPGSLVLSEDLGATARGAVVRTFIYGIDTYVIVGGQESHTDTDQLISVFKVGFGLTLVCTLETTGTSDLICETVGDEVRITEFQTNGYYYQQSAIRTLKFIPSRNELTAVAVTATDNGIVGHSGFTFAGRKYYFVWGNIPGPTNVSLYRKERSGLYTKVPFTPNAKSELFNNAALVAYVGVEQGVPLFTLVDGTTTTTIKPFFVGNELDFTMTDDSVWFDQHLYSGAEVGSLYGSFRKTVHAKGAGRTLIYQQHGSNIDHGNQNRPLYSISAPNDIPDVLNLPWQSSYNSITVIIVESVEYYLCVSIAEGLIELRYVDTLQLALTINATGVRSADWYMESSMHRVVASIANGDLVVYEINVSKRTLSWKEYSRRPEDNQLELL